MTLDEIFEEWERDGKIDQYNLGDEALKTVPLLSKYWKHYIRERKLLRKKEIVFKKLRKDKAEFFIMGPHEGTPKEWTLPLGGRVVKTEVEKHLEIDRDVVAHALDVADQKDKVELLEAIINSIKGRTWDIDKKLKYLLWSEGAK